MISLVGDLMGWTPDRKRKSTKNRVFIQLRIIADDSSYSLNNITVDLSPIFVEMPKK